MEKSLLRDTTSVCPSCFSTIGARIVERSGNVYMEKECPAHGAFSLFLSGHPSYYRQSSDFYFSVMNRKLPQRDYIVHTTNRCNINCPICLINANGRHAPDYPAGELARFLKDKKNAKIDLMGAEPTMRDDLPDLIKIIARSGNISALHTNGIKLADHQYARTLKEAGLHEVHLQFDGFDERVYVEIRGAPLLPVKLKALENLQALDIATDLVATIVRGCNEKEIAGIIDYGVRHSFVREVFFLGCRFLGKARKLPEENCIMPDELIDMVEEHAPGTAKRASVLQFQKLYFALLSAFSRRKCFYIQHFMLWRTKKGSVPIDAVFDLGALEKKLDRFKELKAAGKDRRAFSYLLISLFLNFLKNLKAPLLKESLSYAFAFVRGFPLARLPRKALLLGFISACDAYSFDDQIARQCGKGALSVEFGVQECGALDNIRRDNLPTAHR